jgi:hypothetical protein
MKKKGRRRSKGWQLYALEKEKEGGGEKEKAGGGGKAAITSLLL